MPVNQKNSEPSYAARDITAPGQYDIDMENTNEWWPNIEIYERNGLLWLVNPENGVETALKGINGWMFRKSSSSSFPRRRVGSLKRFHH